MQKEKQQDKPAPAAAAPAEERKPPPALPDGRFVAAEYERTVYVLTAEAGTIPADLTNPGYYAHIAHRLKCWDRLEIRGNDGTWLVEALVLDVSRLWAKVHILQTHKLTTIDYSQSAAEDLKPYFIRHNGPHDKWVVIRRSDQEKVSSGHGTPEDANQWMVERMKAD